MKAKPRNPRGRVYLHRGGTRYYKIQNKKVVFSYRKDFKTRNLSTDYRNIEDFRAAIKRGELVKVSS